MVKCKTRIIGRNIIICFLFSSLENKDKLMLDFFVDENLKTLASQDYTLHKATQKDLQSADKSSEKVAQIFKVIQANLNSDLVNKTGAIFQFNVKGIRHR